MTLLLVMLHGLILMCQGMAFSVAMNSKRNNALVALIIATNFVEIKGEPLPWKKTCRSASASPSLSGHATCLVRHRCPQWHKPEQSPLLPSGSFALCG